MCAGKNGWIDNVLSRRNRAEARLHAEIDAEIRFHLEEQIRDYVPAGIEPEQARRRARCPLD